MEFGCDTGPEYSTWDKSICSKIPSILKIHLVFVYPQLGCLTYSSLSDRSLVGYLSVCLSVCSWFWLLSQPPNFWHSRWVVMAVMPRPGVALTSDLGILCLKPGWFVSHLGWTWVVGTSAIVVVGPLLQHSIGGCIFYYPTPPERMDHQTVNAVWLSQIILTSSASLMAVEWKKEPHYNALIPCTDPTMTSIYMIYAAHR